MLRAEGRSCLEEQRLRSTAGSPLAAPPLFSAPPRCLPSFLSCLAWLSGLAPLPSLAPVRCVYCEQVKQCFVLEVDADAYVAAAQGPAAVQDFFFGRMVLSEGARLKCIDPALKQQVCTGAD